jgi:hypothetical protein
MTSNKSFKARVRTRMEKTGESYTTARRQLVDKSQPAEPADRSEPEPAEAADGSGPQPAQAAAGSPVKAHLPADDAVRERTGRGHAEWFVLLDAWGGTGRTHTEIARWLVEEHGVPGWWAQSVTVSYEQERGMRAPGQRSDGYFSANASRTVAVPVDRLFDAVVDDADRRRWLPDPFEVRTATRARSVRANWGDGSTRVAIGFEPKGDAKAVISVMHERLPDAEETARMKAYWRDRLADLKKLLEE